MKINSFSGKKTKTVPLIRFGGRLLPAEKVGDRWVPIKEITLTHTDTIHIFASAINDFLEKMRKNPELFDRIQASLPKIIDPNFIFEWDKFIFSPGELADFLEHFDPSGLLGGSKDAIAVSAFFSILLGLISQAGGIPGWLGVLVGVGLNVLSSADNKEGSDSIVWWPKGDPLVKGLFVSGLRQASYFHAKGENPFEKLAELVKNHADKKD